MHNKQHWLQNSNLLGEELGLDDGVWVGAMLGTNEGEAEGYADVVGARLGLLVGDIVGGSGHDVNTSSTTNSLQVLPITLVAMTEPNSSISVSVADERRHKQPLGSLVPWHHRFLIKTFSIMNGRFQSTSK
jgi:hypothetical protein